MLHKIRNNRKLSRLVETLSTVIICLLMPSFFGEANLVGFMVSFIFSCVLAQLITGDSLLWESKNKNTK